MKMDLPIIKVVFLGLDAAGKTTILNILSKKYSFISNITPTKTIERRKTEIFGYNVLNWDVPGQQKYREELTFKETQTLRNANVLVFVIDAQDTERTPIALDYFQRVLQKITDEKLERPFISVLIHKVDPDISEDITVLKNAKRIQDTINKTSFGFSIEFFLTTMFIEPTIFIAFSSVVRKALSKKRQMRLKEVLHYFADELLLNSIVILDKNNFIVNHFEREPADFTIIQDFVYTLNSAYQNAKKYNLVVGELKLILKDLTFVFMPISLGDIDAYIIGSSHDPDISLEPIKANLSTELQKVFKK